MVSKKKKKSNKGIYIFAGVFFAISFFIVILMGAKLYNENKISKGFEEVQGRFVDYSIYSNRRYRHSATYKLTYMYTVEGKDYYVDTDYGVGVIPTIGSEKTVKYDPSNPANSIVVGGANFYLLLVGVIFCIATLMIFIFNYIEKNRYNSKKWNKIKLLNAIVGIILCLVAVVTFYIMYDSVNTNSISLFLKKINIFILVPLMFFLVGIMVIVRSFFPNKAPISGAISPKLIYIADKVNNSKTLPIMSCLISLIVIVIILVPTTIMFIAADKSTKITLLPFLVMAAIVILVLIRKTIATIKEYKKNK